MSEPSADDEVAVLRARVAELEGELAAQARATNAVVARSEQQLYWLERWHVDLNVVMQRRSAQAALEGLKVARGVARAARRTRRRLQAR